MDCDKTLKLNDPLLSSFPIFDSPHSSSQSSSASTPSSPSSTSSFISTDSSTNRTNHTIKNKAKHPYQLPLHSDEDNDDDNDNDNDNDVEEINSRRRKKNKYFNSELSSTLNLNLKDPMMSASPMHSPPHFSTNDFQMNYMDHMFFSSQYLSSSLTADDSIDLCTILKSENTLMEDMIMIG